MRFGKVHIISLAIATPTTLVPAMYTIYPTSVDIQEDLRLQCNIAHALSYRPLDIVRFTSGNGSLQSVEVVVQCFSDILRPAIKT